MEQSTTTRDTPRWVQQWEADRERGLSAYVVRVGVVYFGGFVFLALAAIAFSRGTLADVWFPMVLWALAIGVVIGFASWFWRGAWYGQYRDKHR